jgi:AraC-like DNA-binding protein
VEFNRKALYRNNEAIFAGSINGLYKIQINDIPLLIEGNKTHLENAGTFTSILLLVTIFSVVLLILMILLLRFQKKLKAATATIANLNEPKAAITREKIETFIESNLPVASIKTLMDEFQLNAPQLYVILKPDRPGTLIQQIRLATVKRMRANGKSHEEIAQVTGLSVSYLKKLKR